MSTIAAPRDVVPSFAGQLLQQGDLGYEEAMSGEFLNRSGGCASHCQMRAERVSKDVHP
jgi:hypothetical protein